ncbi:MAG: NAD(P)H-hydrate dehydratase [Saprospiraceae bacterium]|nr:NAD(P)H-hydrate dehydratase [Saprospiraceae bacterium]
MKIPSAAQIRDWDSYTIKNEPIDSVDLMERASNTFCKWFKKRFPETKRQVLLICGPGNNGGDGLAIARMLALDHYEVKVWLCRVSEGLSPDAQTNLNRLQALRSIPIKMLYVGDPFPEIPDRSYLIDALFGSGLNRPVGGYWATLIEQLNQVSATRIAVDIPSGLFTDRAPDGAVFQAEYTFSFERPKLAFFLPVSGAFAGEWETQSIGLHPDFESNIPNTYQYLTVDAIRARLHTRHKFDHKGSFGHSLIIAGSHGKIGAALLTAKACLRAGSGLVTIHAPKCAYEILQIGFPEAMCICDSHQFVVSDVGNLAPFKAIGVGPGIGTNSLTERALHDLIERSSVPLVVDADAINILAKNYDWLRALPSGSILSPHPKEFERLVGPSASDFDRLNKLQQLAMEMELVIILKGANTAIADPEGRIFFNTTGNPGMATGGSGDVLTGILTGLLAQGYSSLDAALVGVYLHGLAGDIAAELLEQESLLSGDLIDYLGKAFGSIRHSGGLL